MRCGDGTKDSSEEVITETKGQGLKSIWPQLARINNRTNETTEYMEREGLDANKEAI